MLILLLVLQTLTSNKTRETDLKTFFKHIVPIAPLEGSKRFVRKISSRTVIGIYIFGWQRPQSPSLKTYLIPRRYVEGENQH